MSRQPCENGFRPSIDVLFRSAAQVYAEATIAVVLSGALCDGAGGAAAVGQSGGNVIVQDPDDAIIDSLPRRTLEASNSSVIVSSVELAATLRCLVAESPRSLPTEAHNDGATCHLDGRVNR